jgi:hypothetical protein
MSDPEKTPPDQRVLEDILDRIDTLTNHIIDVKGEMYKRSDWQGDETRIYDHINTIQTQVLLSMREALGTIDRRIEHIERDVVPRSEHMTRWENEGKRLAIMEQRLGIVEKRALPAWIVAGVGTLAGAAVSYVAQALIHAASIPIPHVTQ